MSKKDKKFTKAAHIKRNTEGTSNELSFSVLDAAKNRADAEEGKDEKAQVPHFGKISLFSWRPGKKNVPTPTREEGLPLSSGEIITPVALESRSIKQSSANGISGSALASRGTTVSGGRGVGSASSSGVGGYASPEDEIERRKRRRRRQRVFMGCIGAVVAVALVGGGGYVLFQEISKHQAQVSLLDQSLVLIEEADKTTLSVDRLLNDAGDANDSGGSNDPNKLGDAGGPGNANNSGDAGGSSEESASNEANREQGAESAADVLEAIPQAQEKLDEAEDLVNEALEGMRSSGNKEAAEQALVAIEARREMLTSGGDILTASVQATTDKEAIKLMWTNVIGSDERAREAAAMITDTTDENVAASTEKTNEALTLLRDARFYLDELSVSFLAPDIQSFYSYVEKREEALNYAIAANDALLAKERVRAQEQNEAYNTADLEASVLAKDLPEDIVKVVTTAYENQTAETREQYDEARSKASTADAFLRDYLGT